MGKQLTVDTNIKVRNIIFDNRYIVLIFRFILAGTFFVSSSGKLVDIERYSVAVVYNFDILPGPLAIAFGWSLPFIEFACAVSFLLGVFTRLSALGTTMMSISFFIVKAFVLSQGRDIECGCFGAVGSTMASWSIYLDPIVFILSVTVLFSSQKSRYWVSLGSKLSEKLSKRLNLVW